MLTLVFEGRESSRIKVICSSRNEMVSINLCLWPQRRGENRLAAAGGRLERVLSGHLHRAASPTTPATTTSRCRCVCVSALSIFTSSIFARTTYVLIFHIVSICTWNVCLFFTSSLSVLETSVCFSRPFYLNLERPSLFFTSSLFVPVTSVFVFHVLSTYSRKVSFSFSRLLCLHV